MHENVPGICSLVRAHLFFYCFHFSIFFLANYFFLSYKVLFNILTIENFLDGKKGARCLKEIQVKVFDNDIEKAMRILKKKIQNNGLFKRLKLKKGYEKPSEFKRRKQREALRRERIATSRNRYER